MYDIVAVDRILTELRDARVEIEELKQANEEMSESMEHFRSVLYLCYTLNDIDEMIPKHLPHFTKIKKSPSGLENDLAMYETLIDRTRGLIHWKSESQRLLTVIRDLLGVDIDLKEPHWPIVLTHG